MNRVQIQAIIDNKDFESAKAWYLENGDDEFLKILISGNDSSTFEARLFQTITELLPEASDLEQPEIDVHIDDHTTSGDKDQFSGDVLVRLKYRAGQEFKKMKEARLGIFSKDREERRQAALKALEFRKANMSIWEEINFYKQYGCLPEKKETKSLSHFSAAELFKMISNHEKYIRKMGKKQREGTASEHVMKELEKRKALLLKINKEIAKR